MDTNASFTPAANFIKIECTAKGCNCIPEFELNVMIHLVHKNYALYPSAAEDRQIKYKR